MSTSTRLAEALPANHSPIWDLSRQLGVDHAVTSIPEGPGQDERPGYETLGRLFALGYVRGLIHATTESAFGHHLVASSGDSDQQE